MNFRITTINCAIIFFYTEPNPDLKLKTIVKNLKNIFATILETKIER